MGQKEGDCGTALKGLLEFIGSKEAKLLSTLETIQQVLLKAVSWRWVYFYLLILGVICASVSIIIDIFVSTMQAGTPSSPLYPWRPVHLPEPSNSLLTPSSTQIFNVYDNKCSGPMDHLVHLDVDMEHPIRCCDFGKRRNQDKARRWEEKRGKGTPAICMFAAVTLSKKSDGKGKEVRGEGRLGGSS
jgi:hypothetical protein